MELYPTYFYVVILLFIVGLGIVLPLLCILMAWLSAWGRFSPRKDHDDPWAMKEVVRSLLDMTKLGAPNQDNKVPDAKGREEGTESGGKPPTSDDKAANKQTGGDFVVMDPEDAVQLVLRMRRVTFISFLALAAFIVLCAATLMGIFLSHPSSPQLLRVLGELRPKQSQDTAAPARQEATPQTTPSREETTNNESQAKPTP